MSFLLIHVGQVESESDDVTLHGIVTLLFVVVNNELITVLNGGRHILEVVEVKRIGQDVITVAPLKRSQGRSLSIGSTLVQLVLLFLRLEQSLLLSLGQDLKAECLMSVLILHNSPSAIFVIKRHPVVLNVFINFDVSNLEAWETYVELFRNPRSKKLV